MAETFRCPSCSAPLDFEGKMMQKCRHCGSNVIVPADVFRSSDAFGGVGSLDFSDVSALTGKALKIAEIQRLIQSKQKIYAIKLFRETFGGGLKEAKDAVDAMENGKSVDISGMRIQAANLQSNPQNLEAVKKAGIAIGGSILITIIITTIIIVGATGAIFYFTLSSVNRSIDRTIVSPETPPRESEADAKAVEILKFGGEGNGAGKFKDNRAVAVDGNGKIYSADYNGGKIQVFDKDGKYLNQWIADAKMNLYDLVADRKGTVYIAQNKGIFAYEGESGKLLYQVQNVSSRGLALMPDGKIAATIGKGFAIFDSELNKLKEFKDANEAADTTFGFEEIAADGDGVIYMITRTENYICKFSADGKFLDRFKVEGSPNAIAVDNKGRIFISDTSDINVFDAEGKQLESFRTTQAFGMAFNDAGELFVASRPFVVKYQLNF
ncbi:hypothetical protein BH20ACI4_BH20ACI4_03990 [soil metagenome]